MKVGVFTFSYATNYGAVLQCLALYRTLRNMGAEVDVIRYIPEDFRHYPPLWKGWGIKKGQFFQNIPKKWIAARHGAGMIQAFDEFRETHLSFSAKCSTPQEIAQAVAGYDALITGSDQVWHFAQAPAFFLEWGAPYSGRRISYAPCCGHARQPMERVDAIREWLLRFHAISVRNDFSRELIEPLVGQEVPVVADPTLLTDLRDVHKRVELPCSDYILMYTLGDPIAGGHRAVIEAIRHRFGNLPVVAVVPSAHKPHLAPWADYVVWDAGPAEWLGLIAHAAFMYTDSFHGALFALQYKRPLLVYYAEEGRAPRMVDLAGRYGLESLMAANAGQAILGIGANSYDYSAAESVMQQHAAFSKRWLQQALDISAESSR